MQADNYIGFPIESTHSALYIHDKVCIDCQSGNFKIYGSGSLNKLMHV